MRMAVALLLDRDELGLGLQPDGVIAVLRAALRDPDFTRPFGDGFVRHQDFAGTRLGWRGWIMMEHVVHGKTCV